MAVSLVRWTNELGAGGFLHQESHQLHAREPGCGEPEPLEVREGSLPHPQGSHQEGEASQGFSYGCPGLGHTQPVDLRKPFFSKADSKSARTSIHWPEEICTLFFYQHHNMYIIIFTYIHLIIHVYIPLKKLEDCNGGLV